MKKSNAWVPWAFFIAGIATLIIVNTPHFAGMKGSGENFLYLLMALFFIGTVVSYIAVKGKK